MVTPSDIPPVTACPVSLSSTDNSSAEVIDLLSSTDSQEESLKVAKKAKRRAKGPEKYTRGEMKNFARMVKTIKNVDPEKGHALSTAQFIDANFSDNSEKCVRALRSKSAWKKAQFVSVADKTAQIMRDRVKLFNKSST